MLACAQCPVRDRAACAALDAESRAQLGAHGRSVILNRGDALFRAGDPSDRCATLIRGALKVVSTDADGTEHILALIHPAGFVGELFAPFAHHDVVALGACELCVFSRSQIARTIAAEPKLGEALLRRSQEDLHAARELLALTARRSAKQRVAGLILTLSRAASTSPCHATAQFELPLTRGEIADLLGLTIETVSRQLSAFERDGLVRRTGARGIELLDPAQLETLVD